MYVILKQYCFNTSSVLMWILFLGDIL